MIVKSLELKNYRNYRDLKMEFHVGTNLLYGDNAQGKTNALESIYVCATSKSHKGAKDKEIIRFGEEEAHIKLVVEKKGVPHRIDLHLKKNRTKGVAVNGSPIRRVTELFGILNVVFFAPEDLNIIKNSPAERRRFLDLELCQLDKIYAHHLVNYNKVVIQRNKLLKEMDGRDGWYETLDVWDEQMASYGVPLIARRRDFIKELDILVRDIHHALSGGREKIEICYASNVSEDHFIEVLTRERGRDLKMRSSLTGPHRDDLRFLINGVDVRHFGSQGQQRTAALSLKLAEIEIVKQRVKDSPVLLLDDVLSELDGSRQNQLLQRISNIQTIMTGTGLDDFVEHCFHIDKTFHIEDGNIVGGFHE
ncbi:DNA replication/repair protein RecF [Hominifimenecus sp. rT4P-3]|uniref:DNA replication/repair protein RecF n=1 Tax=Hominifimenecus sp. rT4P-3 TaxID=3242979 RepID=UPI003DA62168